MEVENVHVESSYEKLERIQKDLIKFDFMGWVNKTRQL